MEFSHFVDLFVLEDSIFLDDVGIDDPMYAPFIESKDCPLRPLPESRLSEAVFFISDTTRGIYDAAPTQRTFSLKSYEYWISLSDEDRGRIPWAPHYGVDWFGRDGLLINSRDLDHHIKIAIEELAKTKFTLMPSSRNLLPFLERFHQIDTPALHLYRGLTEAQRKSVEGVLALTRPRSVYLPPLLAILLSRCRTRAEIPHRLIELRAEHEDLRKSVGTWFDRLDNAKSIGDKIQIRKELESAVASIIRVTENRRVSFYREIAEAFMDGLEDGDPSKLVTKPAFAIAKSSLATILPEQLSVRKFTGLIDLMEQALNVADYSADLNRIFGDSLDISQEELANARKYRTHVVEKYGIELPVPG